MVYLCIIDILLQAGINFWSFLNFLRQDFWSSWCRVIGLARSYLLSIVCSAVDDFM